MYVCMYVFLYVSAQIAVISRVAADSASAVNVPSSCIYVSVSVSLFSRTFTAFAVSCITFVFFVFFLFVFLLLPDNVTWRALLSSSTSLYERISSHVHVCVCVCMCWSFTFPSLITYLWTKWSGSNWGPLDWLPLLTFLSLLWLLKILSIKRYHISIYLWLCVCMYVTNIGLYGGGHITA